MSAMMVEDEGKAVRIAAALLEGAGFGSFSFGTNFVLRFARSGPGDFEGRTLPAEIELWIGADWWFDERGDWDAKVARMAPANAVEPDEPVLAYELAALRWAEGSEIRSVVLSASSLRLEFVSGRVITVRNSSDDGDRAWTVTSLEHGTTPPLWSVTAEDGALFVRAPCLRGE